MRRILAFRAYDKNASPLIRSTLTEIETLDGGRVICVPMTSTLRGYDNAALIVVEEAAFVDDDAITSIMPSRARDGRILMISTPGNTTDCYFYQVLTEGKVPTIIVPSTDVPRRAEAVEFDRQHMPKRKFEVEHLLQWKSGLAQFIQNEVIEAAFDENVAAMRIQI